MMILKLYYKYLKKTKLEISTKNKYLRNLKDIFDFINIMYGYGVSVDVIQHLLGHSSSEITKWNNKASLYPWHWRKKECNEHFN